jgi:hypothetical protein
LTGASTTFDILHETCLFILPNFNRIFPFLGSADGRIAFSCLSILRQKLTGFFATSHLRGSALKRRNCYIFAKNLFHSLKLHEMYSAQHDAFPQDAASRYIQVHPGKSRQANKKEKGRNCTHSLLAPSPRTCPPEPFRFAGDLRFARDGKINFPRAAACCPGTISPSLSLGARWCDQCLMHCSDCYSNAALQVASASAGWLVAASDKLLLTWAKCNPTNTQA